RRAVQERRRSAIDPLQQETPSSSRIRAPLYRTEGLRPGRGRRCWSGQFSSGLLTIRLKPSLDNVIQGLRVDVMELVATLAPGGDQPNRLQEVQMLGDGLA